jgi:hypothetical protein
MVLLSSVWFVLWAASEWRARWRLLVGFAGMLAVLVGAGELLLPGWIGYFAEGVAAYPKYFTVLSPLELALGRRCGDILAGIAIFILLSFAWRQRKQAADSPRFTVTLAAFFLATTLAMPLPHPFNQVILILPVLMLLREWRALPMWACIVFSAVVSWPWIGTVAVLLLSHHIHPPSNLALLPSFAAPAVPFLLPLLVAASQKSSELAGSAF